MPDQTDNTTAAHDNNTSRAATLNNTHRSHLRNTHHLHSCYATQRNFHTRLAYVLLRARFDKIVKSGTYQQIPLLRWIMQKSGSPGFLRIVRFETDASAVSSGTSTHALSARGHHELHARVLNHRFTREASCPFIVQMLATCPHNLSKDAIATSARELYQSVEDGYPLTHSASRFYNGVQEDT